SQIARNAQIRPTEEKPHPTGRPIRPPLSRWLVRLGQPVEGNGRRDRGARLIQAAERRSTTAANSGATGPRDRAIGARYARSPPRPNVSRLPARLFFPPASTEVGGVAGVVTAGGIAGDPTNRLKVKANITKCQWRTMARSGRIW